MAHKRFMVDGFGQLELNQVAFRRDGRVESQCLLDKTDFEKIPAENGMLLAIDRVNRTVKFPVDGTLPIAINYTTEHMYDERKSRLKDFRLTKDEFPPRLGFLSVGELFTTNCLCYDGDEFADEDAIKDACKRDALSTTMLYGGACDMGCIKLSATEPTFGPVLRAVEGTTMPDGQFGIKFQVLKA